MLSWGAGRPRGLPGQTARGTDRGREAGEAEGAGYHSSVRIRHSSFDARQHRGNEPGQQESAAQRERPSKSQLKREMTALQELGEQLLGLSLARLRTLPIPEKLYEAIELAQRIRDREGLRRQRQYIGRLMRDVDPQPIRDALSQHGASHRAEVAAMHSAEQWRERLLTQPDALDAFRHEHPQANPQLAKLVASARAEAGAAQHGRHYRELFRLLRDTIAAGQRQADEQPEGPGA